MSKIRGIMNRVFKVGIIHRKVSKNPVEGLETSTKTTYKAIKITPAQTLSILRSMMQNLHFTGVRRCGNSASKFGSAGSPLG